MDRDILQAMKTPSRFQSVRKLNSTFDLKGAKVCIGTGIQLMLARRTFILKFDSQFGTLRDYRQCPCRPS